MVAWLLMGLGASGCSLFSWSSPEQCADDADCPGAGSTCVRGTCIAAADDAGVPDATGPCHEAPAPCDALVSCTPLEQGVRCGDCPAGFAGSGYDGCRPGLTGLEPSAGALEPAVSDDVVDYTWVTGMAHAATSFTVRVPDGVALTIDERPHQAGTPTDSSSLLPYEERTRALELSALNGERTSIALRTRRDWLPSATLRASNRDQDDEFGRALALSGNLLVVGARFEASNLVNAPNNDDAPASGAAYVFDLSGEDARELNILKAQRPLADQRFGTSVAATPSLIAVGAPGDGSSARGIDDLVNDEGAPESGAVWTFALSGNEWSWSSYVKSDNSDAFDLFGTSVAMYGDWLIVGAPGEQSAFPADPSDNSAPDAGAAYVFKRSGSTLRQVAYLKAPHPSGDAQFGYAVAVNQGLFAVGARGDDRAGRGVGVDDGELTAPDSGAVFVFREVDGEIVFDAHLKASNADPGDTFGYSLALSGNTLVVGASGEASAGTDPTGNGLPGAGAAYVFERKDGLWSEVAFLKSTHPRENDLFGRRVAICGETVVIGSPGQGSRAQLVPSLDDDAAPESGALFVARPEPLGGFRVVSTLKPAFTQAGSALGGAVVCDSELVVGGLSGESGPPSGPPLPGAGAVQLYR